MPTLIRLLRPDGLQTVDYTADSLADAVQYEPQNGIYTVANTFNTYDTLKLDAHFDRMEDSARRQNIALNLDRQHVRQALRQMIDEANWGSVRFRVTVSQENPNQLILTIESFSPPSEEMIATGVRCITAPNSARHDALAKTTKWMHTRKALANAMPDGIYDTFLLDEEGHMLEGLGANFYAIIDGKLWTAGEGVLKGISQQIVFEIAPDILPVYKKAPHVNQIKEFSGTFLTSSSRGIIPVVEIDGIQIAEGVPSATTQKLRTAYQDWLNEHLKAL